MSKIEEIIKEKCPDGVPYISLIDLCGTITTGRLNANAMVENGEYPFYTCDATPFRIDTYAFDEEAILISGNGSQVGHINYYKGKFNAYQRTYVLYDFKEVEVKYLLHYLSGYLRDYIMIHSKKGSVPYITLPMLQNFKVPVPPTEVQGEIVNILDTFEEHIECLKKELVLREKSYETIMHSLLRKSNFKKFDNLENYCNFEKGKTPIQKNTPGSYPLVATTEHLQTSDNYQFDCEAVCLPLISARGHGVASITRIYYQSGKFALGNILCAIIPKDNQIKAEFLRNYLFYHKDTLLVPLMRGGANVSLTVDSLKKVQIPIPSIEEQQSIIEKLRVFQEILSKEKGLPAEIEKRQQQYEYYRDKLLSFKEVEVYE